MKKTKTVSKKSTIPQPQKNKPTKSVAPSKKTGFLRSIFGYQFPQVDMSETPTMVKIAANIPGIDPKEIEINVGDNLVRIKGSLERQREEHGERFFHFEREYGAFSRDISLPAKIDTRKVSAVFKHGVLIITLKKIGAETPKKLAIKKKK